MVTTSVARFRCWLFAALILAALAGRVVAQAVAEVGDAGQTITTYQTLSGSGPLITITGTIASTSDVDLFRITISSPSTFSATTTTTSGSGSWGTTGDTQLFLFKLDGTGILANDDTNSNLQSQLPAGDSHLTALAPGDYLIGISVYNMDAFDGSNNLIFQSNPFTGVYGPNPGVGVLDHWHDAPSTEPVGSYTISLTGAAYVSAVPEPATTGLLLALGGGFAAWRARRRAE